MSPYLTRKTSVVASLIAEFGISHIHAYEVAIGWEHAAARRGVDRAKSDFWETGRSWMVRQLAGTPRRTETRQAD